VALDNAQLFGQSRTPRIKQLLGLDGSTGSLRSRRSRPYSDALIFMPFRGPQAHPNQVAEIVQSASQFHQQLTGNTQNRSRSLYQKLYPPCDDPYEVDSSDRAIRSQAASARLTSSRR
jgi:hypothetical protein